MAGDNRNTPRTIRGNKMNITKEDMERIKAKSDESKKDFKNRALMVIEILVGGDIVYKDIERMKLDIYEITHVALGTCENEHQDWREKVEKYFKAFEKDGWI